eukprot:2134196-Pyramimonas_sp.AAC.1
MHVSPPRSRSETHAAVLARFGPVVMLIIVFWFDLLSPESPQGRPGRGVSSVQRRSGVDLLWCSSSMPALADPEMGLTQ